MSVMTFSTRSFNVGEIELATLASAGNMSAGIDLLVARSEPPVTREWVCALSIEEYVEAYHELGNTVQIIQALTKMLGQVRTDEDS